MSSPRSLVLIGNFLPDRQESMQRFNQMVSDGFAARGWKVETWRPEPRFTKWARTYRYGGIPKYLGYLDKFYVFPKAIRARRQRTPADSVFHITDHSNAVYAPHFAGAPLVVTCHDLLQIRSALGEFPQNPVSRTGQRYQKWILDHLGRLKRAICVSHKTREDLQRLTGLSDESTPVVYLGLNYPYRPMPSAEAGELIRIAMHRSGHVESAASALTSESFLVAVGGGHWYKNRTGLVSIFAELQKHPETPRRLLYIGPPLDSEQEEILARSKLTDSVLRVSGVSNEELRAAYSSATGLLFPSWEEGFGWPIVEAQACGCPVFTSNRKPMMEIGGDAARYVDPADPVAAANTIAAALPRIKQMSVEGLRQVQRWDVSRMLAEYEEQYSALLPVFNSKAPVAS